MAFKRDEIFFLLGAGVSADAKIPMSSEMINKVEELLKTEWKQYEKLYYLVKSAILYADGIQGKHDDNFNIERLFNVINELVKKEEHPLYPFIGSWNIRFNEIIVDNDRNREKGYKKIEEFQNKILTELKEWIKLKDKQKAKYFKSFENLKKEYTSFRIFTLNYDLCLEEAFQNEQNVSIERGFNNDRKWDYKKFSEFDESDEPDIYLYKLHGSIDWERSEKTKEVSYIDGIAKNPELIFGTAYKLQYVDPFLFLFSEFRHYSLRAKLIIIIGYGFGDEHINGIVTQALKQDDTRKILLIAKNKDKEFVAKKLNLDNTNQIIIEKYNAKEYLEKKLTINQLYKYFQEKKDDKFWE